VGCGDQPVLLDTSRWQAGAGPAAGGPPEFRVMGNGGRPGSGLVSCRLGEQLQEAAPPPPVTRRATPLLNTPRRVRGSVSAGSGRQGVHSGHSSRFVL
jgi:hypothetical protein